MKLKIILFIIAFTLAGYVEAQEVYAINWDYKDQSFAEFRIRVEDQFNLKFLFKEEWVRDLKLTEYQGCNDLNCILNNLFRNRSLYYFFDESDNVIITKDFAILKENEAPGDKEAFLKESEPPGIPSRSGKEVNSFVEIGNRNEMERPERAEISGYVLDAETGTGVTGVTVQIKNLSAGTFTGEQGQFKISLPRGFYEVQFSSIGYKEKRVNLSLYGPGELNLEIEKDIVQLNEILVSANKNVMLDRFEVGVEKINFSSARLVTTSMGEKDIIKSIILLPGVQSVGEGSAGFNVRGGSADQNLILLHGAPVYNSSHFFGFFSAVNSDLITDLTLYKGGIPSRYGGRISSVLDIETKEGNYKEFGGNIGISPITSHLMVEGPVIEDTLSYHFTARSTYSNWILGMVKNPLLRNNEASFYDLSGKITWKPDKKNMLDLFSYYSHDFFRLNIDNTYGYDNNILALRWIHNYNDRLSSLISINNSNYRYNISNNDIITIAYRLSHRINSSELKADFNWLNGKHKINFGLDVNKYAVLPGSINSTSDSSSVMTHEIDREDAFECSVYLEDSFVLTDFLSLKAGARFSSFFSMGPQTVYSYSPDFSKTNSSIIDSVSYGSGRFYNSYAGPELRLSLNFHISDRNSVKINYNRTRQYLHLLSNSSAISPTDTWKLCDLYLKPEIGDQYAVGFYKVLAKNSLEASVELYYKEIKNMVDYKGGSTLTMIDNIEQYMINAEGKAYGLELVLKNTEGRKRFNIAYTYSRTLMKSTGRFRDEIINSGKWYPAAYDKPHNLVLSYQLLYSRRFTFSADYIYSTGRPYTLPTSTYYYNQVLFINYSDRNKYRIPDHSRLDVSCKISGNLRSKKIAHPNLVLSIYNLLGRENAYSVFFQREGSEIRGYKLSVFGRQIPSVTLSFDF